MNEYEFIEKFNSLKDDEKLRFLGFLLRMLYASDNQSILEWSFEHALRENNDIF